MLINTSLNVKGKPICGTPQMALDCLADIRPGRAAHRRRLVGDQVRIGYSFWGFLGPGITDTPDGGRSHRRTLIDGLIAAGHDIVFLQANRDLREAGHDLRRPLPLGRRAARDRRAVPGMALADPRPQHHAVRQPRATPATCTARPNCSATTPPGAALPTILWDKDRQLPAADPLRAHAATSPSARPRCTPAPGAVPPAVPRRRRGPRRAPTPPRWRRCPARSPLVYVGNQYDRDDAFDDVLRARRRVGSRTGSPASGPHAAWPHVNFIGRVPFPEVAAICTGRAGHRPAAARPVRRRPGR